jgi:hypothetical protein
MGDSGSHVCRGLAAQLRLSGTDFFPVSGIHDQAGLRSSLEKTCIQSVLPNQGLFCPASLRNGSPSMRTAFQSSRKIAPSRL